MKENQSDENYLACKKWNDFILRSRSLLEVKGQIYMYSQSCWVLKANLGENIMENGTLAKEQKRKTLYCKTVVTTSKIRRSYVSLTLNCWNARFYVRVSKAFNFVFTFFKRESVHFCLKVENNVII